MVLSPALPQSNLLASFPVMEITKVGRGKIFLLAPPLPDNYHYQERPHEQLHNQTMKSSFFPL